MKKYILPFVLFSFVSVLCSCSADTVEEAVQPEVESSVIKDNQVETGDKDYPEANPL